MSRLRDRSRHHVRTSARGTSVSARLQAFEGPRAVNPYTGAFGRCEDADQVLPCPPWVSLIDYRPATLIVGADVSAEVISDGAPDVIDDCSGYGQLKNICAAAVIAELEPIQRRRTAPRSGRVGPCPATWRDTRPRGRSADPVPRRACHRHSCDRLAVRLTPPARRSARAGRRRRRSRV